MYPKILMGLIMLVVSAGLGHAQQNSNKKPDPPGNAPREERVVRFAYNKMSILNAAEKVNTAVRRRSESDMRVAAESGIKFQLSDFKIGDVSEIQGRLYRDLVTPPSGDIVQTARVTDTSSGGQP